MRTASCLRRYQWHYRRDRSDENSERGAAAVEFALVLPILVLFLFGIVQYGFGLFQLQAFGAALSDASRGAATGITNCGTFKNSLISQATTNGLPAGSVTNIKVEWLTPTLGATNVADRLGLAKVSATFTPFRIGLPGIPFPSTVTRSQIVSIQDIGNPALVGC